MEKKPSSTGSTSDSLYGSKHLAAQWQGDGTLRRVKALLLADMLGDKGLDISHDKNSTLRLLDVVQKAAARVGYQSYFFQEENQIEDDHLPFAQRGVYVADIIDLDYGYDNAYHHTLEGTMDILSAKSLTIAGDVFLKTIQMLNQR
jgi:glutaminyl-peptide cyclotransferase